MKANGHPQPTSTNIQLSPSASPGYTHADGLTEESATRTSELLNINHAAYHTRFNAGFHKEIQDMWEFNKAYQIPIQRQHATASTDLDLKDPALFNKCLGNDDCYADFLKFFENEVADKGVQSVIREYVLKGDERADDIFCRMYADLVHPMIHLGCGLEFNQPSLIAEALAAACVHDNWPKKFLLPAEEYVRSNATVPSKSLLQLTDSLRRDPHIASGVKSSDPFNKIRDGLLARVTGEQLAPYLAQFQVKPEPADLQRQMSEMMHTCVYIVGAAQRPGKREAMDFVLLHNVTLAVFYPAILAQDWLTNEEKARLIEAKARVDAVMYAGSGSPELYPARITNYEPRHPSDGWPELFHRAVVYRDEGHVAKLIRALYSLEQLPDMGTDYPIAKKDFVKIAHMAVDSVEVAFEPNGTKMSDKIAQGVIKEVGHGGDMVVNNMIRWVFYGGLDNSWQFVPEVGA